MQSTEIVDPSKVNDLMAKMHEEQLILNNQRLDILNKLQ